MYDVKSSERTVGGTTVSLETGKLAKQANGAVVIRSGETEILVTAVASPSLREGIDFFPLTVDIEERVYAAGRIPGSVLRREGRPSEKGTLTARLTDRPIRPSFPDWFRHDVQIIATVLQVDGENQWDIHCITAASAALLLGGVPFAGPIAGVRVAHIDDEWKALPTNTDVQEATIELIVAGRVGDNGVDILMIEAGGFEQTFDLIAEGARKPDEDLLAEGIEVAKGHIAELCEMQNDLARQCTIPEREWIRTIEYGEDVYARVNELARDKYADALAIAGKAERNQRLDQIKAEVVEATASEFEDRTKEVKAALRAIQKKIIRRRIVDEGKRIDGRGPADIRQLHAEVGLLSRAHGTGLFQRGETQALSVTTLAMPRMEQFIGVDELNEKTKRFMHHYNFPPFSTGEAYPMRGPSRRAIGHGALAEKAVLPVVPLPDEFPYALRVVSEVLESNGSTSMASTCGATLSLMDAGVPLRGMVGGIAMGLIADDGRYVTLTDILGSEDNYGDMDFKVAGTDDVVTALQLDTKTTGIPSSVLVEALAQAKEARLKVLDAMRQAISEPRESLSPHAPLIEVIQVPVDKIGEVIGPKGKMVNSITERTGVQIDIEDDGRIFVAGLTDQVVKAKEMINEIAFPRQLQVGEEFDGVVVNIREFGAFVNVAPGKDGLVHISKLAPRGQRVEKAEDVVSVGDTLRVKISEIRPDGKLSLVPVREGEEDLPPGSGDGGGDRGGDGGGDRGGSNGGRSGGRRGRR